METFQDLSGVQNYVFQKRPPGIIVDTNVLLLLLAGYCDKSLIKDCKLLRNKLYTEGDFDLLVKLLSFFKAVIVTPHILTELSNLTKQEFKGQKLLLYFESVIKFLEAANTLEQQMEIKRLCGIEAKVIANYGFTDLAIFKLSEDTGMPFLTDDVNFYIYSIGKNMKVLNFTYFKNYQKI